MVVLASFGDRFHFPFSQRTCTQTRLRATHTFLSHKSNLSKHYCQTQTFTLPVRSIVKWPNSLNYMGTQEEKNLTITRSLRADDWWDWWCSALTFLSASFWRATNQRTNENKWEYSRFAGHRIHWAIWSDLISDTICVAFFATLLVFQCEKK